MPRGGQRDGCGRRVNEKVKAFKIIGNIYYVGTTDMTMFLFFEPHAEGFGFLDKMKRLQAGEQPNPFYSPQECRSGIEKRKREFQAQLEKERAEAAR